MGAKGVVQSDVIAHGETILTPKRAAIAASALGDNTLVAAVLGKKIRVLGYHIVCAAAVTVRFEDGAGGTALTGQKEYAANSGGSPGYSPLGWFETSEGNLLNLELSDAVSVDGHLIYVEI